MRILHISNYYYPHIGGIEQVARDVINSLPYEEQRLICFNHDKGTETDLIDGVPVTRVNCQAKISSQSIAFGYGKELKKLMDEFRPEVVVFHYPNPFVAHFLLKYAKRDFKLVLWWHLDIVKQKFLKKFFRGQNLRLLKRADRIVATSPNYIEGSEYLSAFRDKCTVIPNCVNTDRLKINDEIKAAAEKIKAENAGKTILFAVGRHVPYKGMEYLVKASRFLDERFRIFIGGKGPLTESLKELAAGDEKITLTGRISDEELLAYILACDIFCFPSITKNEAFGIALAEAMYFSKPAVTFTIAGSGVNYVNLNGITGLEVENCNAEKFAEAIKLLAGDDDMRAIYGAAARERVVNNFLFENFAKKIEELIKGLNEGN